MAKNPAKKTEKTELPGAPLDRFEAGVRALVDLRDRGKFLIFLARRRSVQLIGRGADFFEELTIKSEEKQLEPKDSKEVLEEIRRYLSLRASTGDSEQVVRFLIQSFYDDESKKLESAEMDRFRAQLERKVAIVEQQLHTPAFERRDKRFANTTAACLEDLEFELVAERSSGSADDPLREPFLRLKLRYSEGTEAWPRGFGAAGFFPLFGGKENSFEFECDESDIDLLLVRLAAAKQRLGRARETTSEVDNG